MKTKDFAYSLVLVLVFVGILVVALVPKRIYLVDAETGALFKSEQVRLWFHAPCWDKPYYCKSSNILIFDGITEADGSVVLSARDARGLSVSPKGKFGDYYSIKVGEESAIILSKEMFDYETKELKLDLK